MKEFNVSLVDVLQALSCIFRGCNYVAALLCFSFLIDWMSVIGVCAGVEKNGSTSA